MLSRRWFVVLAALVLGCNQTSPTALTPTEQKIDPKVEAFHAKVAAFVEEARALAALMGNVPSLADYDRNLQRVRDASIRIPEPPAQRYTQLPEQARQVVVMFDVDRLNLKLGGDLLRLGDKTAYERVIGQLKESAVKRRAELDAMEVSLK
jgi:hypothetical protein